MRTNSKSFERGGNEAFGKRDETTAYYYSGILFAPINN